MSNHCYQVGDEIFLREDHGSIGRELNGVLHRPFMFYWDGLYIEEWDKAGIDMHLYVRYVDDSQQVAEIKEG